MTQVAIIDYGMGNLASVKKAFDFLKIPCAITQKPEVLAAASHLVLPGVGAFAAAMQNLKELNLESTLMELVQHQKKPIMGICLGMQLLFDEGTEPTINAGLGWIPGRIAPIVAPHLRIPHLGWNTVTATGHSDLFTENLQGDYYFIHSYCAMPLDAQTMAGVTNYGGAIPAVIHHNNIFACQFHPEKSQALGLKVLQKFVNYYA
jgi:glutamine amidotransferase